MLCAEMFPLLSENGFIKPKISTKSVDNRSVIHADYGEKGGIEIVLERHDISKCPVGPDQQLKRIENAVVGTIRTRKSKTVFSDYCFQLRVTVAITEASAATKLTDAAAVIWVMENQYVGVAKRNNLMASEILSVINLWAVK